MEVPKKREIITTFKKMEKMELKLSKLYFKASKMWPDYRLFWRTIALQEIGHAKGMHKIINIFRKNPDYYIETKVFNPPASEQFYEMLLAAKLRMKEKDTTWRTMLYIARDLEKSIVESQMDRILNIDRGEITQILDSIQSESVLHLEKLNEQIENPKSLLAAEDE